MSQTHSLDAGATAGSSGIGGRLFIIACCLGITSGIVGTAGMLLAAAAFATASSFVIPFIITFEGFRDAGGTNAVTITGSWVTAVTLTIILAGFLSFCALRRSKSSSDSDARI